MILMCFDSSITRIESSNELWIRIRYGNATPFLGEKQLCLARQVRRALQRPASRPNLNTDNVKEQRPAVRDCRNAGSSRISPLQDARRESGCMARQSHSRHEHFAWCSAQRSKPASGPHAASAQPPADASARATRAVTMGPAAHATTRAHQRRMTDCGMV